MSERCFCFRAHEDLDWKEDTIHRDNKYLRRTEYLKLLRTAGNSPHEVT